MIWQKVSHIPCPFRALLAATGVSALRVRSRTRTSEIQCLGAFTVAGLQQRNMLRL